jgi:hypothetical protein
VHAARRSDELDALADALARLPGVGEVRLSPYTGSVLCRYDPERLKVASIGGELARLSGAELVEDRPSSPKPAPPSDEGPGEVARQVARVFKDLDDDVLFATGGKLDMGTLATLGFLAAGVVSVARRGELTSPPWFNLAWWGLRTFMLFEADAVQSPGHPADDPGDLGGGDAD